MINRTYDSISKVNIAVNCKVGQVYLIGGTVNKIDIMCPSEQERNVIIEHSGDKIHISTKKKTKLDTIDITIITTDIDCLAVSGGMTIECLNIANNYSVMLSGSNKCSIISKDNHIKATMAGSNQLEFNSDNCSVEIAGAGNSSVIVIGSCKDVNIKSSGSGLFNLTDCIVQQGKISTSGSSNIDVGKCNMSLTLAGSSKLGRTADSNLVINARGFVKTK